MKRRTVGAAVIPEARGAKSERGLGFREEEQRVRGV
jgi:hypothetical protein